MKRAGSADASQASEVLTDMGPGTKNDDARGQGRQDAAGPIEIRDPVELEARRITDFTQFLRDVLKGTNGNDGRDRGRDF